MDYKDIIKLSPYLVKIKYLGWYRGSFVWANSHSDKPYQNKDFQPHIKIDKRIMDENMKIATLVHEIGHAVHYDKHCKCYAKYTGRKRVYMAELHAYRFTLQFLLRHKLFDALRYEYEDMNSLSPNYPEHYKAIAKIKTEKLWERVEKILDNQ